MKTLTFDEFKKLWFEQESDCDNKRDTDQLETAIDESDDFEELFGVIRAWSNKPLVQRVKEFLDKNKAVLDNKTNKLLNKI